MQSMTSGNPTKLIIQFTIPLLIGNIFQQLYSISDTIIVGRLLGVNSLSAVCSSVPLFFFITAITIGFTAGLTVITAQRFGAGDEKGVRKSAAASIIISTIYTLSVTFIMLGLITPILKLMNVPKEIFSEAKAFISMITVGLIMIVFYNLLANIIRALGDSKTPLYFLIFSALLNIVLNYTLIKHLGFGVEGSALGTIISLSISVICCYFYIIKKYPLLHLHKSDWKLDWDFYKQHIIIALPMGIQFSIIALSSIIMQSVCNSFGPTTIAAFTSAMRIEQVATQPMVSFGIAMATYTAQNYGAGYISRIKRGVFNCSMISLVIAIIAGILMYTIGENMVGIFIKDHNEEVIHLAQSYLNISVLFYFFLGQIFIYRNALQGLGRPSIPLISSIVELFMRSFAAIILAAQWGYLGVCIASPIAWVGGSLVVSIGYYYILRKISKHFLSYHAQTGLSWQR